jgi:hypothetical protein
LSDQTKTTAGSEAGSAEGPMPGTTAMPGTDATAAEGSMLGSVATSDAEGQAVDRAAHLGYLAHEIRNPMSTALWTAELLGRLPEAERGGERGARLAAICLRSLGRIRLLVEDHLLCERLDAGGYPVRIEPVPLAEALAEALARKPADPVPVEADVDAGLACLVDRALLIRVLEGVIGAAAGGAERVVVEARAVGPVIELRVMGGPVGSLELPQKGAPTEVRGRALALPAARAAAEAIGGRLAVSGGAYLVSIPAT